MHVSSQSSNFYFTLCRLKIQLLAHPCNKNGNYYNRQYSRLEKSVNIWNGFIDNSKSNHLPWQSWLKSLINRDTCFNIIFYLEWNSVQLTPTKHQSPGDSFMNILNPQVYSIFFWLDCSCAVFTYFTKQCVNMT